MSTTGTIGMAPSQTNTQSYGMGLAKSGGNAVASNVGTSIGNEVGYWMGELTGSNKRRSKEQLEQQKQLNALQEQSNIRQADYTQGLNKDYFDYTAEYNKASNQVSRLKEAGLNPALMYGMQGAAGSTGASGGGKAEGVGGAHASNETERLMAETTRQGMGLQIMKTNAEIRLMESQAKANEANANRTAGSQTDLDRANIAVLFEEKEIAHNNAWITKIDADFAFQMKTALIDNIISNKDVNIQQKDYVEKTIDLVSSNIRKIDQEINNLQKQENLTDEQIKLVKEQVAQITANIMQKWEELRLKGVSIEVQREQIGAMVQNNIRDNATKVSTTQLQKSGTIMGGVQTILNEGILKPLFGQDYNKSIMQ